MSQLLQIAVLHSKEEAEVVVSILRENEIDASISFDNLGGMAPYLTTTLGVRLLVPEEQVTSAKSIVESFLTKKENVKNGKDLESQLPNVVDGTPSSHSSELKSNSKVQRAYVVSILGFFIIPLFGPIYALYILANCFSEWDSFTKKDRTKFFATLLISIGSLVFTILLFGSFGH